MIRKRSCTIFVPVAILLGLLFTSSLPATEKIAEKVEQDCDFCHTDPMGGEALNEVGLSLRSVLLPETESVRTSSRGPAAGILRLLVGYIHIVCAVFWFGTILFVHLVLKPSYAAGGLPRGEVRVGIISMVIMAVTGVILILYRVPSFSVLIHSRFGILLLIKVSLFIVMVASGLFTVFCIGPRLRRKMSQKVDAAKRDLSADELKPFDGCDGSAAYLSYAGIIYDVSTSRLWKGGVHAGRHHAGTDLTQVLEQAPHGDEVFSSLPQVGKLTGALSASAPPWYVRAFYFIAYMNLCIVLLIILILALWRW